jgi:hypothetical protein
MEKHLPYFDLLESFSKEECPLCRRIARAVDRFFTGLLYEGVNDVQCRARFNAVGGFCNLHAYKFVKYHDGLAVEALQMENEKKGENLERQLPGLRPHRRSRASGPRDSDTASLRRRARMVNTLYGYEGNGKGRA